MEKESLAEDVYNPIKEYLEGRKEKIKKLGLVKGLKKLSSAINILTDSPKVTRYVIRWGSHALSFKESDLNLKRFAYQFESEYSHPITEGDLYLKVATAVILDP